MFFNVLREHKLKLQLFMGTWLLFSWFLVSVKSRNLETLARESYTHSQPQVSYLPSPRQKEVGCPTPYLLHQLSTFEADVSIMLGEVRLRVWVLARLLGSKPVQSLT